MENFYLIVIIVFCFIFIIKQFSSFFKKHEDTQELIESNNPSNKTVEIPNEKITEPIIPSKNKWLYPTDEFGDMKKGVVYNSTTYEREINENNTIEKKIIIFKSRKNSR